MPGGTGFAQLSVTLFKRSGFKEFSYAPLSVTYLSLEPYGKNLKCTLPETALDGSKKLQPESEIATGDLRWYTMKGDCDSLSKLTYKLLKLWEADVVDRTRVVGMDLSLQFVTVRDVSN